MKPEPLTLEELIELRELNELDVLYKIAEIVSSRDLQKRVEQTLGSNNQAGIDVRRNLQDIKLLSNVIRDKIQVRKDNTKKEGKEDNLDKAIKAEEKRIAIAKEKEAQVIAKAAAAIAAQEAN